MKWLSAQLNTRGQQGDEPYVFISPITDNDLLLRADTDKWSFHVCFVKGSWWHVGSVHTRLWLAVQLNKSAHEERNWSHESKRLKSRGAQKAHLVFHPSSRHSNIFSATSAADIRNPPPEVGDSNEKMLTLAQPYNNGLHIFWFPFLTTEYRVLPPPGMEI